MKNILDLKDKKILYQLDLNSRQPNSKIAKKVGLSKDIVNYRIKNLEKKGYIKGYYTVIDFSRLGYFSMRIYLKLFDTSLNKEKEILKFLINDKKVFYVSEIEGKYNINFAVWVKDIYEFEEFYSELKKKFKKYIKESQMSIFTKVHHFHRAYLLNKKLDNSKKEVFGRERLTQHDNLDLDILKILARNARIPLVDIAEKLKRPQRTIAFRIKQLEKKHIIQGYRFIFDFSLYDYKYYKVDFTLKNMDKLKELIDYSKRHPNILYIDETIGGSDFECDIEVESKEKFIKIIKDLRINFLDIRDWEYFAMKRYEKLLYFPED